MPMYNYTLQSKKGATSGEVKAGSFYAAMDKLPKIAEKAGIKKYRIIKIEEHLTATV